MKNPFTATVEGSEPMPCEWDASRPVGGLWEWRCLVRGNLFAHLGDRVNVEIQRDGVPTLAGTAMVTDVVADGTDVESALVGIGEFKKLAA